METVELLGLLFVVLGTNVIWYIRLKKEKADCKRVCLIFDKTLTTREEMAMIYSRYLNDICSGDATKENEAKTAYKDSIGYRDSMGSDAWINVHIFNKEMAEMIMAGTPTTINEEKVNN